MYMYLITDKYIIIVSEKYKARCETKGEELMSWRGTVHLTRTVHLSSLCTTSLSLHW